MYEFIQETVRLDFLNSTLTLRSQIIQDLNNPLSALNTASPGEYKNSLEEIKLMCEQLNVEHENIR